MAKACARHILLKTKEQAEKIKQQLANGADFSSLAKKHSQCSSAKKGVDLGPGKMLKAFDNVVFKAELSGKALSSASMKFMPFGYKKPVLTVHGSIKTKFGYHCFNC